MHLTLRGLLLSPFVRSRLRQLMAKDPAAGRTCPLDEAAEAIRHQEVEHARAKIVVTV
ncbi:hypothetical protein QFZ22_001763 [Streptomyces canus]|uniref:Uncharacterized protein n=1 Tax=Streptomyces canus TaxID=58343 RepID=A0AAW8F8B4_9ACTN|nr:hypothetical protein [Streptomyces canus]MDQ0905778.1 hypothetical protein [Streptomyces canus]